jgi:hypothetical protein
MLSLRLLNIAELVSLTISLINLLTIVCALSLASCSSLSALPKSSSIERFCEFSINCFQPLSFDTTSIFLLFSSAHFSIESNAIASGNSFFLSFLFSKGGWSRPGIG